MLGIESDSGEHLKLSTLARASPLKRRLAPPRPVRGVGDGAVEALLRVEVPRAADQLLAMQADVQAVTLSTMEHSAVVAALTRHDLICLISRDARDVGLLVVDIGLLTALVEIQTLGQVTSVPPKERVPTRTDAVVVSDMVDMWMADIARVAGEAGLGRDVPFSGFVREHGILDLRAVELTLDPGKYRSMRITMALGDDAKIGVMTFFVPATGGARAADEGTLGARLRPHLMDAEAGMQAILTRFEHPLGRVLALRAGDVLPIDPRCLTHMHLEVREGVPLAQGRLGQVNGFRAVRLTPVSKEGDAAPFFGAAMQGCGASKAREALPDLPASSEALELPDASGPTGGDLPDLPDLSDLPDLPDMEALPDLPDLPDLGDFPDLPNLPDLPRP